MEFFKRRESSMPRDPEDPAYEVLLGNAGPNDHLPTLIMGVGLGGDMPVFDRRGLLKFVHRYDAKLKLGKLATPEPLNHPKIQ